jgi:hypothetical protein
MLKLLGDHQEQWPEEGIQESCSANKKMRYPNYSQTGKNNLSTTRSQSDLVTLIKKFLLIVDLACWRQQEIIQSPMKEQKQTSTKRKISSGIRRFNPITHN